MYLIYSFFFYFIYSTLLFFSKKFRKVGKVYTKPNNRIQQLQNVSLALTAITDDNVKLVNVGKNIYFYRHKPANK